MILFKTGFTCGAFDCFHAGHALMLDEARSVCDRLVVGLHSDPTIDRPDTKNKPVQTLEERKVVLGSCRHVDEIWVYDTESQLLEILKSLLLQSRHVVRIIGADWKGKPFTGHDLPIEVYYNSRDHGYSSSDLRKRIYWAEHEKRKYDDRGTMDDFGSP